jgi:hypothetical protein
LDEYPGATTAFSLRLLNTDYTGDAVVVRRASDNTTQSIGFVDGELDTDALNTFCSGTDGFVTTWYDQSGNGNNATQTTASQQPKIFDGINGIVTENGKPIISFDGASQYLIFTTGNVQGFVSIFTALKSDSNNQDSIFLQYTEDENNLISIGLGNLGTSNAIGSRLKIGNSNIDAKGDNNFTSTSSELISLLSDSSSLDFYLSSLQKTDNVDARSIGIISAIGARNTGLSAFFEGKTYEIIIYETDESSNRTGIETNINDFYSIY